MDELYKEMNTLIGKYESFLHGKGVYQGAGTECLNVEDIDILEDYLATARSLKGRAHLLEKEDPYRQRFCLQYGTIINDLITATLKFCVYGGDDDYLNYELPVDGQDVSRSLFDELIKLRDEAISELDMVAEREFVEYADRNKLFITNEVINLLPAIEMDDSIEAVCDRFLDEYFVYPGQYMIQYLVSQDEHDFTKINKYISKMVDAIANQYYPSPDDALVVVQSFWDVCKCYQYDCKYKEALEQYHSFEAFIDDFSGLLKWGTGIDLISLKNKINQNIETVENEIINSRKRSYENLECLGIGEELRDKLSLEEIRYLASYREVMDLTDTKDPLIDYSSALLPVMKTIESLLYTVIIKNYLHFLWDEQKNGKLHTLKHVGDCLLEKHKDSPSTLKREENANCLEIGGAFHCITWGICKEGNIDRYRPKLTFLEFITRNGVTNGEDVIDNLARYLYQVRPLRNQVAHRLPIYKDDLDCDVDLFEVIKFLLVNFDFCFH